MGSAWLSISTFPGNHIPSRHLAGREKGLAQGEFGVMLLLPLHYAEDEALVVGFDVVPGNRNGVLFT